MLQIHTPGSRRGRFFASPRVVEIILRRCSMPIAKELLEILACPRCKQKVKLNEKRNGLVCEKCALVYPIKDDIPVMLIDEAAPLK